MAQHPTDRLWSRLATALALAAGAGGLAGLALGVDCLCENPAIRGARDVLLTLAFFAALLAALGLPLGIAAALGGQAWARLRRRPAGSGRPAGLGVLVAGWTFAELWDRSHVVQELLRPDHKSLIAPSTSWLHLGAIGAAALAAGWLAAWVAGRILERGGARRWLAAGAGLAAALLASLALRPAPEFYPPAYTPDMGERSALRVRLIVVDGADWRLIRPLIEAGRMPHLAGLIERGVAGELGVTHPSKSPHMWTALSTGLDDDVNGLCEFFAYRPPGTRALITRYPGLGESPRIFFREAILRLHRLGLGSIHYASSAQKCVPEIWDYLGDAGKTVAVVGWRFTAPPEPVRGFLLTDRFGTGDAPEDTLYPVELAHLVVPAAPSQVQSQLASFGDVEAALRETLERDLLYVRTSRRLLAELEPDFLAVAHRTVDRLEHRFMLKHTLAEQQGPLPPHLAGTFTEESIQRGGQVVPQAYALFDQDLGRLLEDLGDDVVIVVSDHGHDLDGSGHQLGPSGIIVMAGGPIARGAELESATVFDVLPTVLHLMGLAVPRGLAGRVLEEALEADWSQANPVAFLAPRRRAPARTSPARGRHRPGRRPRAARARLRGIDRVRRGDLAHLAAHALRGRVVARVREHVGDPAGERRACAPTPRPRVVIAAVPRRIPEASIGGRAVVGDQVLVAGEVDRVQRAPRPRLPESPIGVTSTSIRWLSVPPETIRRPRAASSAARARAFSHDARCVVREGRLRAPRAARPPWRRSRA